TGVADPGYSVVDLSGRHFPNRRANRHALLTNENDFLVMRHRRNDDRSFAMHHHPAPRFWARWCSHVIGHNFEMCAGKMAVARNRFPTISILDKLAPLHAGRL